MRLTVRHLILAALLAVATRATASVNIVISPSSTTVGINQEFDVVVQVQAGAQPVDAAAGFVDFDPAVLTMTVAPSPGGILPVPFAFTYDNSLGQANCAAGAFSDFPSGTFTLCTLHFRAIAITASTSLAFTSQNPRKTNATYGGSPIFGSATGGAVAVIGATPTPPPTPTITPGGATPTRTPTTRPIPACPGDCDGDGAVTTQEMALCTQIASGAYPLSACPACDADGNGVVTAGDLTRVAAARSGGCGQGGPTPERPRRALNAMSEDAVTYGKMFLPGWADRASVNLRVLQTRPSPCRDGDWFIWDNGTHVRTCVCKGGGSYCASLVSVP